MVHDKLENHMPAEKSSRWGKKAGDRPLERRRGEAWWRLRRKKSVDEVAIETINNAPQV